MKAIKLIMCLLFAVATTATAQTYRQRGVVRMITTSAESPIRPVEGVKVAVGNNVSEATGADGVFTLSVAKQFQVNGVAPSDEYILALPTKGKSYTHSPNDLDVVVTTKTQKDADYKRLYNQIKAKYDEQSDQLMDLKRKYQRKLNEMQESDAEYARTKAQRDSLQALYLEYINHEQKMDEEIKKLAEDLAITDYISLDSIARKTYELKCQGEWQSLSNFLHDVMRGNAAAFLQEGIDLEKQKQEELKQSQIAKATRFRLVEDAIESFKMQHLNDSVSRYYQILTDASPDNWGYLNKAGVFETTYMANIPKAIDYHQRAIATNSVDTLLAISYCNMGMAYECVGDYDKALEQLRTALRIRLLLFGTKHPEVAECYICLGNVSASMGLYELAMIRYEKALKLYLAVVGDNNPRVAAIYTDIGSIYKSQGNCAEALEYHKKALQILITAVGENVPNVAAIYNNLGSAYYCQGDYDKALECHERSLNIQLPIVGENHPDIAAIYNNIALVYSAQGNPTKALEQYGKALDILLLRFGENHPYVGRAYSNIGLAYCNKEEYGKGLECFKKALQILQNFWPESHSEIQTLKNNIESMESMMSIFKNTPNKQ